MKPEETHVADAVTDIADRVLADLDYLATLTAGGSGVTRLAYSKEDEAAKKWFEDQCVEAGLEFESDPYGNAFGWSPGSRRARPLLIGSHLDSVIEGGRYDGALGVVVGLEVARHVVKEGNGWPVGVANFACEESTRFGFGVIGSRALLGTLNESDFALTDRDGKSLRQVLDERAATGPRIEFDDRFAGAYLEVHIDQGNILAPASEGYPVGLVTSIVGVSRMKLIWTGEAAHSGAHLRENRRDPLLAAAQFVLDANALWERANTEEDSLAVTVGQVDVLPNSPNTVARRVEVILDVRSSSQELLDSTVDRALSLARDGARARNLDTEFEVLYRGRPVRSSSELIQVLEESARTGSIPALKVPSLSGHDAMILGSRLPIAMLFVGNPSGFSHSPKEDVDAVSLRRAVHTILLALPGLVDHAQQGNS
jgi:hydantoinase/carbamoylase family amidase